MIVLKLLDDAVLEGVDCVALISWIDCLGATLSTVTCGGDALEGDGGGGFLAVEDVSMCFWQRSLDRASKNKVSRNHIPDQ